MRVPTLALLATTTLGGCVIYDEGGPCGFCGPKGGAGVDTGVGDLAAEPVFWLDPATVEADTTAILSLQSDQAVDFATIVDLNFLGDLSVCTSTAREDELLVTVSAGATLGPVDLVITTEDGTSYFVDNALTIVEAGDAGDTGSASGGGDGSASGDDGSTGGDDGSTGGSTGGC